jgi:hypothetical protein
MMIEFNVTGQCAECGTPTCGHEIVEIVDVNRLEVKDVCVPCFDIIRSRD